LRRNLCTPNNRRGSTVVGTIAGRRYRMTHHVDSDVSQVKDYNTIAAAMTGYRRLSNLVVYIAQSLVVRSSKDRNTVAGHAWLSDQCRHPRRQHSVPRSHSIQVRQVKFTGVRLRRRIFLRGQPWIRRMKLKPAGSDFMLFLRAFGDGLCDELLHGWFWKSIRRHL
jgi:hypothetical protein